MTFWLFAGLLLVVALQRLCELRLSSSNERYLRSRGGREHAARHFKVMAALHGAWLVAMLAEVWLLDRRPEPWLLLTCAALFVAGQVLRYAAIYTLGPRWSVRIYTLPGEALVSSGIYRYLRHPNYVGVVLEIAALPLLHSAWLTAVLFSTANALLLRVRVTEEERALSGSS